jgi:capsular exopolysaccharide synthesis family protein
MQSSQRASQNAQGDISRNVDHGHLMDYVRIVYKRRWIAIPIFLVGFVFGAVNTLRETPVYQSRLQLLIESDAPKVARLDQMFQNDTFMDDEFRQTQFRILQSRSLARRVLDDLRLWDRPRLGDGPEPKATLSITGIVSSGIGSAIRLAKTVVGANDAPAPTTAVADTERKAANETASQSAKIDQFLSGLSIVPVRNSRIVEIRYSSTDPVFASTAANAVSKAYIQQDMESRFTSSKDAADWLGDRMTEQRRALEASESALQAFKEKNGAVSVADSASNIVVQRLTDLNGALTKAKTERINKEALYNQLKSAEGSGTLDTFPAVIANDYIQKLRADLADLQKQQAQMAQRYGDRNPEMIKLRSAIESAEAKLQNELSKVVVSVKNEYQAALSEEQSLQSALNSQKDEALSQNRKGIEYGVLMREVESNKQIYESLMQRTKETGISSELKTTNVRVVDPAEVPRSPYAPDVRRGLMVSFGGSLLFALGLAFGLEYLDNRIKTPDQIRRELGLPFLGMVPAVHGKQSGPAPLLHNEVPPQFAEAIRSLRTSLLFSSADEGAKTLVITSTGPGEGKTLVASNIAIALAQAGQRVILIDADMRRPRVHELFDRDQEPGLSNLLVGRIGETAAIAGSPVQGLAVLSAGHIPPNPSELLSSEHFKDFVVTLKHRYDWIIFDCPPVMAVTDACILAHDATGVLFVIGAEMTNRGIATVALDQLESANAKFVGAVLNNVELERHSHYYSQYYRASYAKHYARTAP